MCKYFVSTDQPRCIWVLPAEEGSSSWESSTENEIDEINSEQQLLPQAIIGEVTFVSDDNTGRRS